MESILREVFPDGYEQTALAELSRVLQEGGMSSLPGEPEAALGAALGAVMGYDARGFFEHCGYRAPVQSLSKAL